MSEIISYCGLICRTCPIYVATREENKGEQAKMRVEIAKQCREHYGMNYSPEDITDCDGCKAETDRLFPPCNSCYIRNCARQKKLENCAYCVNYICDKLQAFFSTDSAAKARLEEVRNSRL